MFKDYSAFTALFTITIAMLAAAFVLGLLAPEEKDVFLGLAAPYGAIFGIIILLGLLGFWLIICLAVDALRNSIALSGE